MHLVFFFCNLLLFSFLFFSSIAKTANCALVAAPNLDIDYVRTMRSCNTMGEIIDPILNTSMYSYCIYFNGDNFLTFGNKFCSDVVMKCSVTLFNYNLFMNFTMYDSPELKSIIRHFSDQLEFSLASKMTCNGSATNNKKPLFSFGVISDVQYADIPDGFSFRGIPRYYQHSLQILERAVSSWNNTATNNLHLNFVINLGDIVDGQCPKSLSQITVEKLVSLFQKFNGPVYHLIGNHCLYNLPRDKLISLFNIPSSDKDNIAYYEFSPVPEFRIVVLDSYEISAIGWPKDHPITSSAMKLLQLKNPNINKNNPTGLAGLDRRFVMFNGAFGEKQLDWLDGVLRESEKRNQKVIICSHQPLEPSAATPEALPWNYDEVLRIIHRYNVVKACFSGHEHKGGYSVDGHGIHHRVLEAALECPPGSNSYGHVEVYHDRLVLSGTDRMKTTEMVF